MTTTSFGGLLCKYRERKELTQKQAKLRLEKYGGYYTHTTISSWETGKRHPTEVGTVVAQFGKVYQLSSEEMQALLEAHLAEVWFRLWGDFHAESEKLARR